METRAEAVEKYGSLRSFSQLIEDTYTRKNQGLDHIGNLDPVVLRNKVFLAQVILNDIMKGKRTPQSKAGCKEALEDLSAIYTAVLQGLCDRYLQSELWCPNCEDHYRVPKLGNKYLEIDTIKKNGYEFVHDEKQICPIPKHTV